MKLIAIQFFVATIILFAILLTGQFFFEDEIHWKQAAVTAPIGGILMTAVQYFFFDRKK